MKTGAFVIHLKRARKRGDHVRALLGRLPIKADIIDAIDGQALSEAQIRAVYALALHRPRYPFQLSASEVACFLSHRKAWQMIVDGGLDAGLVIEDDVEVSEDAFASQLKLALERIRPADYIRFPRWTRGERGPAVAAAGADTIIEPSLPGLGMQMQLVGREAAAALLAATERFDRPVDTTIQMRWLHPVRVLS
ncbi:MAG: glycosyltransferase family 25 protein, partial [Phyllobacterium sp.]